MSSASENRLPVFQCGRLVGTLPQNFDPLNIKSRSFFYDPRPGDFRLESGCWIAANNLGLGDFRAVTGFEPADERQARSADELDAFGAVFKAMAEGPKK